MPYNYCFEFRHMVFNFVLYKMFFSFVSVGGRLTPAQDT